MNTSNKENDKVYTDEIQEALDVLESIKDDTYERPLASVKASDTLREIANSMKRFDIWAEGYAATIDRSGASCLGSKVLARSFNDAVEIIRNASPDRSLYTKHEDGHWTFWGCRLFDNERHARVSFG